MHVINRNVLNGKMDYTKKEKRNEQWKDTGCVKNSPTEKYII